MKKTALAISVVLAIAVGIGIYKFTSATQIKSRQPCANNLRVIDGAKDQWAIEARAVAGAPAAIENILPYLKNSMMPTCNVVTGTYVIGKVGEEPRCSVHGTHSQFNPDRY